MRGFPRVLALNLLALNAGLMLFMLWHQAAHILHAESRGIDVSLLKPLPAFLFFALILAGTAYLAVRGRHGPSILLGTILAFFQGSAALWVLAGVGT